MRLGKIGRVPVQFSHDPEMGIRISSDLNRMVGRSQAWTEGVPMVPHLFPRQGGGERRTRRAAPVQPF